MTGVIARDGGLQVRHVGQDAFSLRGRGHRGLWPQDWHVPTIEAPSHKTDTQCIARSCSSGKFTHQNPLVTCLSCADAVNELTLRGHLRVQVAGGPMSEHSSSGTTCSVCSGDRSRNCSYPGSHVLTRARFAPRRSGRNNPVRESCRQHGRAYEIQPFQVLNTNVDTVNIGLHSIRRVLVCLLFSELRFAQGDRCRPGPRAVDDDSCIFVDNARTSSKNPGWKFSHRDPTAVGPSARVTFRFCKDPHTRSLRNIDQSCLVERRGYFRFNGAWNGREVGAATKQDGPER